MFGIYRYDTGIWPFLILFGLVWYGGMQKWYELVLISMVTYVLISVIIIVDHLGVFGGWQDGREGRRCCAGVSRIYSRSPVHCRRISDPSSTQQQLNLGAETLNHLFDVHSVHLDHAFPRYCSMC